MVPEIELDFDTPNAKLGFLIASRKDVEEAVNVVRGVGVMLFGAPPAPPPEGPKPRAMRWPPAAGGVIARVHEAAMRLKTSDHAEIADDLDLHTAVVAMTLAKLRNAGRLEGIGK